LKGSSSTSQQTKFTSESGKEIFNRTLTFVNESAKGEDDNVFDYFYVDFSRQFQIVVNMSICNERLWRNLRHRNLKCFSECLNKCFFFKIPTGNFGKILRFSLHFVHVLIQR
jgi:hypothetical protein